MDKIEIGSEMVECQKQIAENLNRYFVKSINNIVSDIDKNVGSPSLCTNFIRNQTLSYFRMVDFDELKEFVFSLPNKGSPDDVSSEFIKNTLENIKEPLLNLINSSIETGKVPTLLKVSTIIPIEKTKGAVKADDFRPVNMLSTTEIILE